MKNYYICERIMEDTIIIRQYNLKLVSTNSCCNTYMN